MEREENLILAIITQAIEDAKYDGHNKKMLKHKASATKWIMDYDPQFQTYCKYVGMDPAWDRTQIIKHVPMTYTNKQKGIYNGNRL